MKRKILFIGLIFLFALSLSAFSACKITWFIRKDSSGTPDVSVSVSDSSENVKNSSTESPVGSSVESIDSASDGTSSDPSVSTEIIWGEWTVTVYPTCTEKGVRIRYNVNDPDVFETEDMDELGHDLIHHEAKAATCSEIGWEAYDECSRCDYNTYVEIPETEHEYKAVVTLPTCTEKGYTTYTCIRGDHVYVDDYVNELGHDISHHEAKAATCSEIGWEAYDDCSRCDYNTYIEIPRSKHVYKAVVTAPTCTERGYTTYTCEKCGDSYISEYTAATGHTYSEDWAFDNARHWHEAVCGHSSERGSLAPHSWQKTGVIIPAATETEEEEYEQQCSVCGLTRFIKASELNHEHTYSEDWDFDEAYHWHQATCDHQEERGEYAEHEFVEGVCVCGARQNVKVTFVDDDGSVIAVVNVPYGGTAIAPQEPVKKDRYFVEWKGDYSEVIDNTEITAFYKKFYTVTFYDYDYSVFYLNDTVKEGDSIQLPEMSPKREGYEFIGWGVFPENINENTSVLAQYEVLKNNVTFLLPDGKVIEMQENIPYGLSATEPEFSDNFPRYYCAKDYFVAKAFSGWYYMSNGQKNEIEDIGKFAIKNDTLIYAEYENDIDIPVVILKISKDYDEQVISVYITLPEEQKLFAIDMQIEWIGRSKIESIYIAQSSDLMNGDNQDWYNYSNKKNNFTISWICSNGREINYSENHSSVMKVTFSGGVSFLPDMIKLSQDTTFLTGLSYSTIQSYRPEIIIV